MSAPELTLNPAPGANGVAKSADASGSGTPITGFHRINKQLGGLKGTPSPQPVHLGIPGTPRMLSEEGPGYVAAKFEGKAKQMEQGERVRCYTPLD